MPLSELINSATRQDRATQTVYRCNSLSDSSFLQQCANKLPYKAQFGTLAYRKILKSCFYRFVTLSRRLTLTHIFQRSSLINRTSETANNI
ncbi:hypothetical protein L596_012055 [Steinernema carpocapsae]|uniref:Uncharacterized protein n=1 Tax=Steinernema carpocapsae TaxID=34508 RepID=A0A4U5NVV2_STECR|nr:hypothetical protein L596_012055 [Steinernema carpocapsae]